MSTVNQLGKYQPYPDYKDSGVEWLGKVPVGWQVKRLKYLAPLVTSKATNRTNPIGLENIESWTGRIICTDSEFQGEGTGFIPGDILFGKLRPYLAKVMLAKLAGEAVGDFHVLRPKNGVVSQYLQYQMLTREFISIVDGSTFGAKMPRASWDFMADLYCAQPREAEASTIAAFLDYETARIDQLIAKQQQLIELLKEKWQAVISHAVTKGLNPNAPMKDSGVEWLGQVPEHWEVKQYRYATKLFRGKFGHRPRNDPALYDGPYPFIQTGDIARTGKYISSYSQTLNDAGIQVSQKFPAGTLVMAIAANIGDTAILKFDAYCPDSVVGFKPYPGLHIEFLRLTFNAALQALEQTSTQSTQANLNLDRIGSIYAAFPSECEQMEILRKVQRIESTYENLQSSVQRGIELLQERRTALISAAVTGKIDLRGWQPPKSEEVA